MLYIVVYAQLQASAAMYMRCRQRRVVIRYRRFGKACQSVFSVQEVQEEFWTHHIALRNIPEA